MNIAELYENPSRVVVTAHRGFSGEYPENTLLAFEEAVKAGADLVEFDLRGTKDYVPVVLHDSTVDRTSNGSGVPGDFTLEEIRLLNFSMWKGPGSSGVRLDKPAYPESSIPTFAEVLDCLKGRIGLNIQVYDASSPLLETICGLYHNYDLYAEGYLTMSTYIDADQVRKINPRIELCVLERQGDLDRGELAKQRDLGIRYIQPLHSMVTPEFCRMSNNLGFRSNMFYSNIDADNRRFLDMGQRGILTDFPNVLRDTVADIEGLH
ncbi:MAG: hypothetical protein HN368_02650 [Spirochaetales bacterium]|jgi:glycerophosphoryl diester phosphodiesterase|nr:hypothetical protein [Spirochaetales bacterium]